jgi:hypothetical protein
MYAETSSLSGASRSKKWVVRKDSAKKASIGTDRKTQALRAASDLAKSNPEAQVIVHKATGEIESHRIYNKRHFKEKAKKKLKIKKAKKTKEKNKRKAQENRRRRRKAALLGVLRKKRAHRKRSAAAKKAALKRKKK